MLVDAFGVVGIVSVFSAIKKAHHFRAHKGLTITIYLKVSKMIEKSWKRERIIGHNEFVLPPATEQNIVRMDVSQKVVAAVLIDFACTLADQQYEIPDILFSEIALFLTTQLNLLLEGFLKDTLILTNEYPTVATTSFLLNLIILASKYNIRAIHVG